MVQRSPFSPYSILNRGVEREVLSVCQQYGMGAMVWSPLARSQGARPLGNVK
jgi:aryl-alcohol dehydrogenase-like predicted oxidoreductase